MNNVSLIYNNSILDIDNFIDSILHKNDSISNLPICEITEKPLFYFITIKIFIHINIISNYFIKINF